MLLRQKRKLEHDIICNLGRGYGELRVLDGFLQSLTKSQIEGSGFDALLKAVEIKRPVIYEKFLFWFLCRNMFNAAAPNLPRRLLRVIAKTGFELDRFGARFPLDL